MPVAWLLGAIQGRTHNTFGQNLVISGGLFIATMGFGEYHVYPYLIPSLRFHCTLFSSPVAS